MQTKPNQTKRQTPGIEKRHARTCPATRSKRAACKCKPSYRAWVFDRRVPIVDSAGNITGHGAKVRKTFPTLAAAKKWRADSTSDLGRGSFTAPTRRTFRDAAEAWLAGAEAEPPTVLNRSGRPYKPSALREVKRNLHRYVLPELGGARLTDVRRGDLQRLVDELLGKGLSSSKVRNVIVAARVVFRHAVERDQGIDTNPAAGLRLPNGHKPRDRAATASEAAELLAALADQDRALWATAFYAGLRRGELQALRWSDVDLAKGVIKVRHSWDEIAGEIEPKSEKGKRTVPVVAMLRDYLTEHKVRTGRDGTAFVFGRSATDPFTATHVRNRALGAWAAAAVGAFLTGRPLSIELVPIGLHECRHTAVSLMHDAGLSLERIGDYIGHSSAYMTDRYRHLLEGHEAESARLLDDYFARADTRGRIEQLED